VEKLHKNKEDFYEGDITNRIYNFEKYQVVEIPINKINMEGYEIDRDDVNEYIKKYKELETYPPIILGYYDWRWGYDIVDGNHRGKALKKIGLESIICFVLPKKIPKINY